MNIFLLYRKRLRSNALIRQKETENQRLSNRKKREEQQEDGFH